jgi:hypothetical protein
MRGLRRLSFGRDGVWSVPARHRQHSTHSRSGHWSGRAALILLGLRDEARTDRRCRTDACGSQVLYGMTSDESACACACACACARLPWGLTGSTGGGLRLSCEARSEPGGNDTLQLLRYGLQTSVSAQRQQQQRRLREGRRRTRSSRAGLPTKRRPPQHRRSTFNSR